MVQADLPEPRNGESREKAAGIAGVSPRLMQDVATVHKNGIPALADSLRELAASIEERGLLHPPVVTPEMELVCGHRRLEAFRFLGRDSIEVRVIEPDDLLLAERDENELRKDFTLSERVAIAHSIKERIGKRQGARTDLPSSREELRADLSEVSPGNRTEEVTAAAAGFSSRSTFRQADALVARGIPELVEAMDAEEVSISAAVFWEHASVEFV